MKTINQIYLFAIAICLFSCQTDEEITSGLMEDNLQSMTQTFTLDLNTTSNSVTFFTDAGCEFRFSKNGFTKNGEPVSGEINVEVIEIFDKGTMAITGAHTMTDDSILISGGEFRVEAYQDGDDLDYDFTYRVEVPSSLSGDYSEDMQLFVMQESMNISPNWISAPNISDIWGVFGQSDTSSYSLNLSGFGWFNCDKFLDDPRPRTKLDIKLPSQFDDDNSRVFLAIKGETSSLGVATLGKYPIGLDVHLIFIAEVENQFLYQIISGPVSEDEYKFDRDKMQSVNPDELKDIINGLE